MSDYSVDQDNGELLTQDRRVTGGAVVIGAEDDTPRRLLAGTMILRGRRIDHVPCFVKYCSGIEFSNNGHAEIRPVGTSFSAHLYRTAFPLVIVSALGETLSLGKDRVEMADKSKKAPKKMPKQMSRQQQQQRQEQMGDEPQGMTRAGQEDRREQRRPGQH